MSKSSNMVYKTLVVGVIVLFIGIGIQPAIAITKDGDNNPPDAPKISGPTRAPPGTYEYTFNATDPDDDDVKYFIDWGDGNAEDWFGPFASGEEVPLNHTYNEMSSFRITAKAKDIHGAEGPLGTFWVEISKSRQISNLFTNRFLERFQILRYSYE